MKKIRRSAGGTEGEREKQAQDGTGTAKHEANHVSPVRCGQGIPSFSGTSNTARAIAAARRDISGCISERTCRTGCHRVVIQRDANAGTQGPHSAFIHETAGPELENRFSGGLRPSRRIRPSTFHAANDWASRSAGYWAAPGWSWRCCGRGGSCPGHGLGLSCASSLAGAASRDASARNGLGTLEVFAGGKNIPDEEYIDDPESAGRGPLLQALAGVRLGRHQALAQFSDGAAPDGELVLRPSAGAGGYGATRCRYRCTK